MAPAISPGRISAIDERTGLLEPPDVVVNTLASFSRESAAIS
jgi:hypothetical protein